MDFPFTVIRGDDARETLGVPTLFVNRATRPLAQALSLFWLGTGRAARHPRRRNDGGRIRFRTWCRFHNLWIHVGRRLDHAPAMLINYATALRATVARPIRP